MVTDHIRQFLSPLRAIDGYRSVHRLAWKSQFDIKLVGFVLLTKLQFSVGSERGNSDRISRFLVGVNV